MQLRSEKWVFPVFDIHDLFQNDRTFEEECNKKYNKSSIPVFSGDKRRSEMSEMTRLKKYF